MSAQHNTFAILAGAGTATYVSNRVREALPWGTQWFGWAAVAIAGWVAGNMVGGGFGEGLKLAGVGYGIGAGATLIEGLHPENSSPLIALLANQGGTPETLTHFLPGNPR